MPNIPASTLTESASWLLNAGIDDMQRRLAAMTGTPQDLADLHSALAHETAGTQRVSRLKPLQTKLRSFPTAVEIVTTSQVSAADLLGLANAIDQSIDLVTSHEGAFEEATLEHRLEIGLNISKAMEVFTASTPNPTGKNQHSDEVVSTVDTTSRPTTGFVTWLGKYVPRLKRPTAYRYAAAYRSLGIPAADASPARIKAKLKDLRHFAGKSNLPMPTLAALVKAAPKPPKPPKPILLIADNDEPLDLKIGDAREFVATWITNWDNNLKAGRIEYLPAAELPALLDFITEVRDHVRLRIKSAKPALK